MPRTREFDPVTALDDAMQVFWHKGFADTSIDDLVNATGVSRYGLYDEFGSKRGLFNAVLKNYQEKQISAVVADLEGADASLSEIYQFFEMFIYEPHFEGARKGCLMCNTLTEEAAWDKECVAQLKAYQKGLRETFRRALENAIYKGELSAKADPLEMANYLLGVTVASSAMCRQPADENAVSDFVHSAISRLV